MFDNLTDRIGSGSLKWDATEKLFGLKPGRTLPMWIADMDFAAPDFIQDKVKELLAQANYGYFGGLDRFLGAVCNWMSTRHGWQVEPEWMTVTAGLGNGIGFCLNALTTPADRVAIMTPVYHEFAAKIAKAGRTATELPLSVGDDGRFAIDFDRWNAAMTGHERMLLMSSPHNPAGRIWTPQEQRAIAEFCERHDMLLVADEVHHDLVFPGETHVPMAVAAPTVRQRLIVTVSASKTFNLAGTRTGCIVIPDETLRSRFQAFVRKFDFNPNLFGIRMTEAAYSEAGAAWVDQLVAYLAGNAARFTGALGAMPGVAAMPMQSTYLSWIDFSGTGLSAEEIHDRVYNRAQIAATPGAGLGTGGELGLRFNLGTQRARVDDAIARLQAAFSDL